MEMTLEQQRAIAIARARRARMAAGSTASEPIHDPAAAVRQAQAAKFPTRSKFGVDTGDTRSSSQDTNTWQDVALEGMERVGQGALNLLPNMARGLASLPSQVAALVEAGGPRLRDVPKAAVDAAKTVLPIEAGGTAVQGVGALLGVANNPTREQWEAAQEQSGANLAGNVLAGAGQWARTPNVRLPAQGAPLSRGALGPQNLQTPVQAVTAATRPARGAIARTMLNRAETLRDKPAAGANTWADEIAAGYFARQVADTLGAGPVVSNIVAPVVAFAADRVRQAKWYRNLKAAGYENVADVLLRDKKWTMKMPDGRTLTPDEAVAVLREADRVWDAENAPMMWDFKRPAVNIEGPLPETTGAFKTQPPTGDMPKTSTGSVTGAERMQVGAPLNPRSAAIDEARRVPATQRLDAGARAGAGVPDTRAPWDVDWEAGTTPPPPSGGRVPTRSEVGLVDQPVSAPAANLERQIAGPRRRIPTTSARRMHNSVIDPLLERYPELGKLSGTDWEVRLTSEIRGAERAIDAVEKATPPTVTVPKKPIVEAFKAMADEAPTPAIQARYAKLVSEWDALPDAISWEKFVAKKRAFFGENGQKVSSGVARRGYKVLMEASEEANPAMSPVNRDYALLRQTMDAAEMNIRDGRRLSTMGKEGDLWHQVRDAFDTRSKAKTTASSAPAAEKPTLADQVKRLKESGRFAQAGRNIAGVPGSGRPVSPARLEFAKFLKQRTAAK